MSQLLHTYVHVSREILLPYVGPNHIRMYITKYVWHKCSKFCSPTHVPKANLFPPQSQPLFLMTVCQGHAPLLIISSKHKPKVTSCPIKL